MFGRQFCPGRVFSIPVRHRGSMDRVERPHYVRSPEIFPNSFIGPSVETFPERLMTPTPNQDQDPASRDDGYVKIQNCKFVGQTPFETKGNLYNLKNIRAL